MLIGLAAAEAAEAAEEVLLHLNRHISLHFLVGLWLSWGAEKIYKKLKRYFALHEPTY
jgi:hypothetical protein